MATKIVTKNSSTASAVPTASDLVQGELAVNVADKRLFTEDNGGSIVELGTNPSSLTVSGNIDVDGVTNLDAVDIDGAVDMASTLQVDGAATFTTEITANGGIALGDNDKATFGASDDLEIYHDGSHSYIADSGTGRLNVKTNVFRVYNAAGNEISANFVQDGAVSLYYDGDEKLATTSTGIDVTGSISADGVEVDGLLHIDGSDNANVAKFALTRTDASWSINNETNFRIYGNTGDTTSPATKRFEIGTGGDISFYEDTGTTAKLFWDASAESLGIGTTTTTGTLNIQDGTPTIRFYDSNLVTRQMEINAENGNAIIKVDPNQTEGTSYYSVEIDASERMRIDSSGRVGIGTSSPNHNLSVNSSSTAIISVGDFTGDNVKTYIEADQTNNLARLNSRNNHPLAFAVNNTERMRIDSSGNVGIGTSSPATALEVNGDIGIGRISGGYTFRETTGGNERASLKSNASNELLFNIGASTEAMRISSAGNVGIGTSSPSGKTHSVAANNQVAVMAGGDVSDPLYPAFGFDGQIGSNGGRGAGMYLPSDGTLAFSTAGSERLRIDSSGKLLVGSTANLGTALLNVAGGIDVANSDYPFLKLKLAANESIVEGVGQYQNMTVGSAGANAYLRFKTADTERVRIDSSGNLLVGTTDTSPHTNNTGTVDDNGIALSNAGRLSMARKGATVALLNRTDDDGEILNFRKNGTTVGSISVTSSATAYNTSSDGRLKENIADADDAGSKIDAIQVRKFDWKADGSHQDYGMIAQELQAVAPEAVSGDADSEEMMGVDYSKLVPMLIKEIQSLRNRVAQLEE